MITFISPHPAGRGSFFHQLIEALDLGSDQATYYISASLEEACQRIRQDAPDLIVIDQTEPRDDGSYVSEIHGNFMAIRGATIVALVSAGESAAAANLRPLCSLLVADQDLGFACEFIRDEHAQAKQQLRQPTYRGDSFV